jgi:hypothetical protein
MKLCFLVLAFLSCFIISCLSQIPCDEAYGTNCPESSGFEVGDCLKKLEPSSLSKECLNYIDLHETCKQDIVKFCLGKEYTGDLLVCLSEWTAPQLLTAECLSALPKKEKKERKLSAHEKKKAAERRK